MVEHYKPLSDKLTIKESSIHGLGLFAKADIQSGENLGVSHIEEKTIKDGEEFIELFRTPLGGFYNHSDNSNCSKVMFGIKISDTLDGSRMIKTKYHLIAKKNIKAGEEITVTYTFYKV